MKFKELAKMDAQSLETRLLTLKRGQLNLRFKAANAQVENTSEVRKVRREIAQIKTLQSQRRQEEERS